MLNLNFCVEALNISGQKRVMVYIIFLLKSFDLDHRLAIFFEKDETVNISGFADRLVADESAKLGYFSRKAVIDDR